MNVSSIALAPNDYRDYLAAMERLYPLPELPEQHTPFLGPWQDDDDMLFADIFSENTPPGRAARQGRRFLALLAHVRHGPPAAPVFGTGNTGEQMRKQGRAIAHLWP